jgi:serine phosphatase RsbU (regulator of sigma subunit)
LRAVVLENTIGVTEPLMSAEIGKHAGQSTGRASPLGATVVRDEIKSPAFQNAELQSERIRIFGVLGFIAIFIVVMAVRVFVIRTATRTTPWVWSFLLAAIVIAYESWMLRKVDLALKATGSLGAQVWILSTILETSIPAFAVAFLTSAQVEVAYRPLASPAVLVFFIFIILSTLRLNPWIAVLSGIVAAVTYICAALYLGWRPPLLGAPAPVTQTGVSLNAITLLVGGLIAGAVAGQIRKHVRSALREAETKRKLEAVQHDLQVARSIQQSLLPQEPPQIEGFDIAGWNRPADDTGGDYFDWKILSDGKVVVSLADVTGHGIGPALLATACHAYARSNFRVGQELSAAIEHLNQELGADLTTGRFVTFVAAVFCPGCPEMEMLSAGHGPLFIYSHSEDHVTELGAHALPLGILPSFISDPPTRLHLHSGDLVLLATDGFFEWENDQGEQFGVQRMEGVMRASRDSSASEIISHLYDAVLRFSNGTKQQDDLTAVLIKSN